MSTHVIVSDRQKRWPYNGLIEVRTSYTWIDCILHLLRAWNPISGRQSLDEHKSGRPPLASRSSFARHSSRAEAFLIRCVLIASPTVLCSITIERRRRTSSFILLLLFSFSPRPQSVSSFPLVFWLGDIFLLLFRVLFWFLFERVVPYWWPLLLLLAKTVWFLCFPTASFWLPHATETHPISPPLYVLVILFRPVWPVRPPSIAHISSQKWLFLPAISHPSVRFPPSLSLLFLISNRISPSLDFSMLSTPYAPALHRQIAYRPAEAQ